jgi:hypothetical protein
LPCACSLLPAAAACASSSSAAAGARLTTGMRPRRDVCAGWPCCCAVLLLPAAADCCICCCSGDLGRAPPASPASCCRLSLLARLAAEAQPGEPPGSSEFRRELLLPPLLPGLSLHIRSIWGGIQNQGTCGIPSGWWNHRGVPRA